MKELPPISFLCALIEAKDSDSTGHCGRVSSIAAGIAEAIGLESGQIESIRCTAQIHDLGKIAIPDEILRKPTRLTDREFAVVRRHPQVGDRLLSAFPELGFARNGVLCHHERWDGHGYPSRLGGSDIPIASRIIAIADSFDAICSDRPYARARSTREGVHEILRCAGTQFDPQLAVAFADTFGSFAPFNQSCKREERQFVLDTIKNDDTLHGVVATDRRWGDRERNVARIPHMLEQTTRLITLLSRSLTSSERLVLELHYLDRLPCQEIAEILETTESHIDQVLSDVRSRISGVRRTFVDALCESA
ncbi:MAG: HD domain-containing protein [Phycisphaerales bacterium]|nr:HD domain-containing protein [Phycisphaerales bacterium]